MGQTGRLSVWIRQKIDCEKLLQWTYREEIPKREASNAAGGSWSMYLLGTRIDSNQGGGGLSALIYDQGPPHPDALLIDHVVRGLPRFGGELVTQKDIRGRVHKTVVGADIANLADHIGDNLPPGWAGSFATTVRAFEPAEMLRTHAILGNRPIWNIGAITVQPARGTKNQPEVSWQDHDYRPARMGSKRGGYYSPGACCALRYEPPPFEIAAARAEYLVWYVSLARVAQQLSTLRLDDFEVLPPAAPALPWRSEARATTEKTLADVA